MRILIVGGGDVAEELIKSVDLRRNEVIVVDSESDRCRELSSKYDINVVNKDATDVSLYTSEVSMTDIDSVISLTDKDETNLFVLSIAKVYNVPIRITRVNDPRVAELVLKLGLGVPIISPSITANMIKNYIDSVRSPKLLTEFEDFKLYLVSISETDKVVNKAIKDVELPPDTRILLIFDGSKLYPPKGEEVLVSGYQLIILSKASEDELSSYLKG
ncbi:MAG: NAD-binding protein [Desulfurococcaceae archaeon]|jgi:trk system potassium uptake protein TrkA|nr:NAD-binding protein [Desulfurococcaceae archaeon]